MITIIRYLTISRGNHVLIFFVGILLRIVVIRKVFTVVNISEIRKLYYDRPIVMNTKTLF